MGKQSYLNMSTIAKMMKSWQGFLAYKTVLIFIMNIQNLGLFDSDWWTQKTSLNL